MFKNDFDLPSFLPTFNFYFKAFTIAKFEMENFKFAWIIWSEFPKILTELSFCTFKTQITFLFFLFFNFKQKNVQPKNSLFYGQFFFFYNFLSLS